MLGLRASWSDRGSDGTFVSVTAGVNHSCGITTGGSVTCWGLDDHGQATPPQGAFTSLTLGRTHTCGVTPNGTVTCWGDDGGGPATRPNETFVSISSRERLTYGVRSDGSIVYWGVRVDADSALRLIAEAGGS